jgi:hypothetical protein
VELEFDELLMLAFASKAFHFHWRAAGGGSLRAIKQWRQQPSPTNTQNAHTKSSQTWNYTTTDNNDSILILV